jgi:hypothetical protein
LCLSQSRSLFTFGASQFLLGLGSGVIMPVPPSYIAETSRTGSLAIAMGSCRPSPNSAASSAPSPWATSPT